MFIRLKNAHKAISGKKNTGASSTIIAKRFFHQPNVNKAATQNLLLNKKRAFHKSFTNEYCNIHMFGFLAASLVGSLACYYLFKDYLGPRETEVICPIMDLTKNSHHGYIVDSNDFEYAGPKPSGELSGCIVKNKKTGALFLKKGAKSKDALIKEFLIATFLTKVRPGEQPASYIMEEKHIDGNARLYTLSEIHPNSMDLQHFIADEDYRNKLTKKPLVGLEESLASDFMFAKQSDIKFANLVIVETKDAYIVVTIDHEMSGKGAHAKRVFTDDLHKLISGIRDISSINEDPEVFIDNTEAVDFANIASTFMKPEKVNEFYRKVAAVDMKEIVSIIKDIDGQDGLVDSVAAQHYIDEISMVVKEAQAYLEANEHDQNHHISYRCM